MCIRDSLNLVADGGECLPLPGQGAAGQGVYYVGDEFMPTYEEWGRLIARSLALESVRIVRLPEFVTWSVALGFQILGGLGMKAGVLNLDKAREAAAGSWICSSEKAKVLGFSPGASLEERFRETSNWYLAQGWL